MLILVVSYKWNRYFIFFLYSFFVLIFWTELDQENLEKYIATSAVCAGIPGEPTPLHIFKDLDNRSKVLSFRGTELSGKSGIYAFINTINGKRYIGSAQNLYERMLDHLAGRSSNLLLLLKQCFW